MRKTAYFCLCWTVLPSRSSNSFQKQYALKRSILVHKAIIPGGDMALFDGLNKEHTVAEPGFSRWLVPPAALAIHLCIGQVYGFSVFNLPLTKIIGVNHSDPADWKLTSIAVIFGVAIVFLGLAAAVFGTWLERVGPRKAMF